MLSNIKRTKSQIMNHMIYIYKSQESFINDKVWLSYVQCTLAKIKTSIVKTTFYIFSNSNRT